MSYLESVLQPWYKKHFLLVIQPLSTFLKSVSMSEHEDEDHSGLSVHMPKGNFVIPWRGAKKKRERKQYCYLGNDVERRNVPIISHSSVSAPGLFPALFKAVEILTCSHHSLLGIHWWEIKKKKNCVGVVWPWKSSEHFQKIAQIKAVAFDYIGSDNTHSEGNSWSVLFQFKCRGVLLA